MHCDINHSFFYSVIDNICISIYDNTDSSAAMYIRNDAAMLCNNFFKSTDL